MVYLTEEELSMLDKRIDAKRMHFNLLSRPRNQALFHVILYFDLIFDSFQIKQVEKRYSNRRLYNTLNHCIQWIFEFCSVGDEDELSFDLATFFEAWDMFVNATMYSELFSQMSLVRRGKNKCHILRPNIFEISLEKLKDDRFDPARQSLAQAEDPETHEETVVITSNTWENLKKELKLEKVEKFDLRYSIADKVFKNVANEIEKRSLLKWSMNPKWSLGKYTFEELREFWTALQGICLCYDATLDSLSSEQRQFTQYVRIRQMDEWVNEIALKSNLSANTVRNIICDFTYDKNLYESGKDKAHTMFQPFFHFGKNQIGVNRKIVRISNVERNAWTLTKFLRPQIFAKLQDLKEVFWTEELIQNIHNHRLEAFSNIKYDRGNIDLLIIDKKLKFGLNCELKWLTKSDDIAGTDEVDKEIEKGVGQALKANEWITANIQLLAQKIRCDVKELKQISFKPLVICKDNLPSGYLGKTIVPVVNQALFDWIINEPLHQDIQKLWKVADTLSYLPKLGVHYETISTSIEWFELRFKLRNIALKLINRWNPKTDIFIDSCEQNKKD